MYGSAFPFNQTSCSGFGLIYLVYIFSAIDNNPAPICRLPSADNTLFFVSFVCVLLVGTRCVFACRPRSWHASASLICVWLRPPARPLCCTVVLLSSGCLAPVPGCLSTLTPEADLRPPLTSRGESAICRGNNSVQLPPGNRAPSIGQISWSHIKLKEDASYLFFSFKCFTFLLKLGTF